MKPANILQIEDNKGDTLLAKEALEYFWINIVSVPDK